MFPSSSSRCATREKDKVAALDAGADDYITKPFGMEELLARIRAALRRAPTSPESGPHSLATDDLQIDFDTRRILVRGKEVRLTPKEFDLLRYLVSQAGKPVPHRELLQAVWGPGLWRRTRISAGLRQPATQEDRAQPGQAEIHSHRAVGRVPLRHRRRSRRTKLEIVLLGRMRRIIDLTQPIGPDTPVFPGDGPVRIDIIDQTTMNLSRIELSVHTGTHMDAPFHFCPSAATIDQVPLERCMGLASLIDLRSIPPGSEIGRNDIEKHHDTLRRARLAVLHTGWSSEWGKPQYFAGHPRLSADAAEFLIDCGVELIGVDMPSVDQAPYPAHKVLLGAGVLIVENLTNLETIGGEFFELVVLPLKLTGRDGSPVRAIAVTQPFTAHA